MGQLVWLLAILFGYPGSIPGMCIGGGDKVLPRPSVLVVQKKRKRKKRKTWCYYLLLMQHLYHFFLPSFLPLFALEFRLVFLSLIRMLKFKCAIIILKLFFLIQFSNPFSWTLVSCLHYKHGFILLVSRATLFCPWFLIIGLISSFTFFKTCLRFLNKNDKKVGIS